MNPRILVIEDNLVNQDLVKTLLQRAGYTTLTALSGTQGLELFRQEKPDLVLLDINIPGLNGIEVTRQIRSIEASDPDVATPIIAFTGSVGSGDVETYLEAGMNDFLPKPFRATELIEKIKAYLELRDSYRSMKSKSLPKLS